MKKIVLMMFLLYTVLFSSDVESSCKNKGFDSCIKLYKFYMSSANIDILNSLNFFIEDCKNKDIESCYHAAVIANKYLNKEDLAREIWLKLCDIYSHKKSCLKLENIK